MATTGNERADRSSGKNAAKRPAGPHLYLGRTGERIAIKKLESAVDRSAAVNWSYLIRNRNRWAYDGSNQTNELVDGARKYLRSVLKVDKGSGEGPDLLTRLATADMIEVSIPFVRESEGWTYRVLPWD